jgi:hypothetical protein
MLAAGLEPIKAAYGDAVTFTILENIAEGPDADAARAAAGIVKEGEQDGPLAALLAGLKKT